MRYNLISSYNPYDSQQKEYEDPVAMAKVGVADKIAKYHGSSIAHMCLLTERLTDLQSLWIYTQLSVISPIRARKV